MKKVLKVLIVENDLISALLLYHYLKLFGHCDCALTSTGEEAVRGADTGKPDIVLMEITLAGPMNGIEAAKKIVQKNNNVAIAFLTSCDDAKVMEEALEVSPVAYFVKPLKMDEIRELLESVAAGNCRPAVSFNEPYGILRGLSYEDEQ